MSFATPLAFALAALAVPIVVLYILKVRMRRLPVSTNLFWRQIYDEKPPRSIWQNLRHLLSLLAQLAFLGMLVMAIADPYLPWQLRNARRIVLVLDNSASMQATDVGENRFEEARAFALDLIAGLRERDQMAVVVAGDTPEVAVGMTGHIPTLRQAIQAVETSDKSTRLESSIRLGEKLVGDHPHGEVIVLTDGCVEPKSVLEDDPATDDSATDDAAITQSSITQSSQVAESAEDASETKSAKVIYKLFGGEAANIGITQFQTRRSLTDPLGYEILASVMNAGEQPVRCRLEITLDDAPIDVVPLKLTPGEEWKRSFEKTSIEGGTLVAKVTRIEQNSEGDDRVNEGGQDAEENTVTDVKSLNHLLVDDVAWAILPSRSKQKVFMVTAGNLFLQKVFEANPLVELTVVSQAPETWPKDSVIVLHQQVPAELPAGDVFILDPVDSCDLWKLTGQVEDPIITQQAEDSPLMTHIRLDNVVLPKAAKIEIQADFEMLAGTVSDEPIYVQLRRPEGKCLALLVNLEESDLAFRTSFPIMVTNALNWYAGESGQLQPSLATGAILSVPVPESAKTDAWEFRSPSGEMAPLTFAAGGESWTAGPLEKTGVWTLDELAADELGPEVVGDGRQLLRQFAVNLANQRETNLTPLESLPVDNDSSMGQSRWLTRPIWFYLAMVAGLFAGVEWFLYQRRFIS